VHAIYVDQQLAYAAAQAADSSFMFTHQVAAVFCMKWRYGRHLESVMSNQNSDSTNQCVFT